MNGLYIIFGMVYVELGDNRFCLYFIFFGESKFSLRIDSNLLCDHNL